MTYPSNSRVLKAGAVGDAGASGRLYVWLHDLDGKHDSYFQLDPSHGKENQLLATALTAISLDAPVDAFVGGPPNPNYNPNANDELDDWNCYFCYRLYVRRG